MNYTTDSDTIAPEVPAEGETEGVNERAGCCVELEKLKTAYTYVCADLENMRRRMDKESSTRATQQAVSMLKEVVDIVDDLTKLSGDIQHPAFPMIMRKIDQFLHKRGVVAVQAEGVFDPEKHQEAIAQLPAPTPEHVGTIAHVAQKGYTYQGMLLRPAQVVVYVEQS